MGFQLLLLTSVEVSEWVPESWEVVPSFSRAGGVDRFGDSGCQTTVTCRLSGGWLGESGDPGKFISRYRFYTS